MLIRVKKENHLLTAFLEGEIDHHNATFARHEIDSELNSDPPEKLILDFGGVSFMDSSGIGLVMGRYKLTSSLGVGLEIVNVPENIYKVMKLAGLSKLADIKKKEN